MTLFSDNGIRLGITFENADMTIDGESLMGEFDGLAKENHTHTTDNISDLDQYLNTKNYVSKQNFDSIYITGLLTCEDVLYNDGDGLDVKTTSLNESLDKIRAELLTLSNHTIQHLTITSDTNVKVGSPVFLTGEVINLKYSTPSNTSDSTLCIPIIKSTGTYKDFIGVCTEVNSDTMFKTRTEPKSTTYYNNTNYAYIRFATHGDYLFSVKDSDMYKVGDTIDYLGNIVDEYAPLTNKIRRSTVGIITKIISKEVVSVFRI